MAQDTNNATAAAVADYSYVPSSMKLQTRWVLWRYEHRHEKLTKIPKQANYQNAASDDSGTWNTYDVIVARYNEHKSPINGYDDDGSKFSGIGFVLGGEFAGIDLDHCIDGNGAIKQWARPTIERFINKTYMEISPSGEGIKIFVHAKNSDTIFPITFDKDGKPHQPCKKYVNKANKEAVEIYDAERYFTVTGRRYGDGLEVAEMQTEFDISSMAFFGTAIADTVEQFADTSPPTTLIVDDPSQEATTDNEWDKVAINDDEIIQRIKTKDREGKLWQGDFSAYSSQSEADLVLVGYIACLTNDKEQIDRIFRKSDLIRGKWDERRGASTYGEMTIDKAMSNRRVPSQQLQPAVAIVVEYPLTAIGNAEFFRDKYGDECRYVREWKSWIIWDGKRWKVDIGNTRVQRKAQQLIRNDMLDHAKTIDDMGKKDKYLKHAIRSKSDEVIHEARAILAVDADELNRDVWLFNVQNGTIDLRKGELRKHEKSDLLTTLAPVHFDSAATCPTWVNFLSRIFQDADENIRHDLIAYIQKALGYSLTGDVSEQCFFILHGVGRNGKSTLMETIKFIMGEYAATAATSLLVSFDRKYKVIAEDVAALFGVRLAACSETNEGSRFDASKVKSLTGNSELTAERKHEHQFSFKATHKIWLDCNHLPQLGGADVAMKRRVKTIPFDAVIRTDEIDPKMGNKLRGEASGILNWLLMGLKAWQSQGLLYNEPKAIRAAVDQYFAENDDIGQFIADCIENNDAERTETQTVYNVYKAWCEQNGNRPMQKKSLTEQLKKKGYANGASNGKRWVYGMKLRADVAVGAESQVWGEEQAEKDERPF